MKTPLLPAIAMLALVVPAPSTAQVLDISLHDGNDRERRAEQQLRRLLDEHDVTPWIFTREIVIQSGVLPHSHPVLTLNTRHVDDDLRQLSTFVHEQIHWFVNADTLAAEATLAELRRLYPEVPVGRPEGARSEFSTYLHLIVCWLELDAMTRLVGAGQARKLLADFGQYTWNYEHVLRDTDKIGSVLRRHGLIIAAK